MEGGRRSREGDTVDKRYRRRIYTRLLLSYIRQHEFSVEYSVKQCLLVAADAAE
jgi:hypothetical protein